MPKRKFPKLDIGLPEPRFRELPPELEQNLIRLRVQQTLLNDADYERRWWAPLRADPAAYPRSARGDAGQLPVELTGRAYRPTELRGG